MSEHSPDPPPVPEVWIAAVRKILRERAAAHALLNLGTGAIYAAGGVASSPSLLLMQKALPMPVWGCLWLVAGGLQSVAVVLDWAAGARGRPPHLFVAGHIVGACIWMAFALCALLTLPATTAAAGSVLVGYVAVNHMIALRVRRDEAREWRHRSRGLRGDDVEGL